MTGFAQRETFWFVMLLVSWRSAVSWADHILNSTAPALEEK